jgi:hypothetical protein
MLVGVIWMHKVKRDFFIVYAFRVKKLACEFGGCMSQLDLTLTVRYVSITFYVRGYTLRIPHSL